MPNAKKSPVSDAEKMAKATQTRKELLEHYKAEPKVERSLSPLYEPYLGKVIQISINGITIAFPVNGTTHKVPQSFADEIDSRRMAIDATIQKSKRMSNTQSNVESTPGGIQMF